MADDMPQKPKRSKSPWADKPYDVGKGKPPVDHQFKKGGPSRHPQGRPKGSKNMTSYEKLKARRITVGTDDAGRPIRMTLGELIDHQLLKKSGEGELAAIKIVKDYELRLAAVKRGTPTDRAETRRQIEEEQEKAKHAARIGKVIGSYFDEIAHLKKLGIIEVTEDSVRVLPWVIEAAAARPKPGFPANRTPPAKPD